MRDFFEYWGLRLSVICVLLASGALGLVVYQSVSGFVTEQRTLRVRVENLGATQNALVQALVRNGTITVGSSAPVRVPGGASSGGASPPVPGSGGVGLVDRGDAEGAEKTTD